MLREAWQKNVISYANKDPYGGKKLPPPVDLNTEKIDNLSKKSFRALGLLNSAIKEIQKVKEKVNKVNIDNKITYQQYNAKKIDKYAINKIVRNRKKIWVDVRKDLGNVYSTLDSVRSK